MRDHDDLPYIVIERHSGGLGAFLWGALIGAGAALLLAPRSGVQTQEEIRQGVMRARAAAEGRVHAARATVDRTRDRLEDQLGTVREQITTVRERIGTRAEQARDALDSGRRHARDELERRVSDVREGYRSASTRRGGMTEGSGMAGGERIDGGEFLVTDTADEGTEGRPDLG